MHKTNNEKKDRLKWLEDRLQTLESKPIVCSYKKWKSLSDSDKQSVVRQWSSYYDKCKTCPQAIKYHEMRKALKEGNMGLLKKLRIEARQLNESLPRIPKPSTNDPNLFWTDIFCQDYDTVVEEIGRLTRTVRFTAAEIFNN